MFSRIARAAVAMRWLSTLRCMCVHLAVMPLAAGRLHSGSPKDPLKGKNSPGSIRDRTVELNMEPNQAAVPSETQRAAPPCGETARLLKRKKR